MNKSKMFELFNRQIQSKSQSKIEENIVYDIYKQLFFTEPKWIEYNNQYYCIIGFSEDKYDYYWICINNKEKKLQFITYLYKLEFSDIDKHWNKGERQNIKQFTLDYFKEHKNENLIYLNDYINNYDYV